MSYETTVVPADGRDYKTAKAALADWKAGKDFIMSNLFHPSDGKRCSCRDGMTVMIRFDRERKTVIARPEES